MTRYAAVLLLLALACGKPQAGAFVVGSKSFPESRLLGEMMAQLVEARTGLPVERRFDRGGTREAFRALRTGEVDVYPEYTGTALAMLLESGQRPAEADAVYQQVSREFRQQFGLEWLPRFGFDNAYVLVMRRDRAQALGLETLSDLGAARDLRLALSHEFMNRPDGYVGLSDEYGIDFPVIGLDHTRAYAAVLGGEYDVVDGYATDPEITPELTLLADDRRFLPPYEAAPLARTAGLDRDPRLRETLALLDGKVSTERMRQLNRRVLLDQVPVERAAEEFLREAGL